MGLPGCCAGWLPLPAQRGEGRGGGAMYDPPVDRLALRDALAAGADPLGDALSASRTPEQRRTLGAVYTPAPIVDAMVGWAAAWPVAPARVIDAGCGSARFLLAAARAFPGAALLGIDTDRCAAATARANLAAAGLASRARILVADYRTARLPPASVPTLFLGNPPYVRHHDIAPRWKRWLAATAARHGLRASGLSGLHVHFLLATLTHSRPGDLGCLITAAEWLDTGYGALVRDLLAGPLGGLRIDLIDASAAPFPDALTTASILSFQVGAARRAIHFRRVASPPALAPLAGGHPVPLPTLSSTTRWSPFATSPPSPSPSPLSPSPSPFPSGLSPSPSDLISLGDLFHIHRGQVTGANAVFIHSAAHPALPARFLHPAITRARELFAAAPALTDASSLRHVIDLPADLDLDALPSAARAAIATFLRWARRRRAHAGYIARHRNPWWSVRLRPPAPILVTYMARRPPAFVRNHAGAAHLNIAHGLYPRTPLTAAQLDALAAYLSTHVTCADGRRYAGGLTKFEPGDLARLRVPAALLG